MGLKFFRFRRKSKTKYWLNIDVPTKRATLHVNGCQYVTAKAETALKGLKRIKQDGGWLSFPSHKRAMMDYDQVWEPLGYVLAVGCTCLKEV